MAQVNHNLCTQYVQENASVSSRPNFAILREWEVDVCEPIVVLCFKRTFALRSNRFTIKENTKRY